MTIIQSIIHPNISIMILNMKKLFFSNYFRKPKMFLLRDKFTYRNFGDIESWPVFRYHFYQTLNKIILLIDIFKIYIYLNC